MSTTRTTTKSTTTSHAGSAKARKMIQRCDESSDDYEDEDGYDDEQVYANA
jgi:hypothetical protein